MRIGYLLILLGLASGTPVWADNPRENFQQWEQDRDNQFRSGTSDMRLDDTTPAENPLEKVAPREEALAPEAKSLLGGGLPIPGGVPGAALPASLPPTLPSMPPPAAGGAIPTLPANDSDEAIAEYNSQLINSLPGGEKTYQIYKEAGDKRAKEIEQQMRSMPTKYSR